MIMRLGGIIMPRHYYYGFLIAGTGHENREMGLGWAGWQGIIPITLKIASPYLKT
jgi:hypothetical protein